MMSLFHWIIIGQALIVSTFVMIYASGFAGGGVIAGIRLGVLLEIAAIGMRLGFYAVQPFPGKLILYGSVSGLIEMIIVGAIVGAIYKPAPARTPSTTLDCRIERWTLSACHAVALRSRIQRWTFVR